MRKKQFPPKVIYEDELNRENYPVDEYNEGLSQRVFSQYSLIVNGPKLNRVIQPEEDADIDLNALSDIETKPRDLIPEAKQVKLKSSHSKPVLKLFPFKNKPSTQRQSLGVGLRPFRLSEQHQVNSAPLHKHTMFTKVSNDIFQKQLRGEFKPNETFTIMTDEGAIQKLLDRKRKDISVDKRVSERMYYDRTLGYSRPNYHFHCKKTLNLSSNQALGNTIETKTTRKSLDLTHIGSSIKKRLFSPSSDLRLSTQFEDLRRPMIDSSRKESNTTRNKSTPKCASQQRQKAFYYKQMSFVEHKFAKISKELSQREHTVEEMRK